MSSSDVVGDRMPSLRLSTSPSLPARTDDEARRLITEAAFARCASTDDPHLCRQALQEVVVANLRVAKALASAQRDKGIDLEDLEQVAYTALVAAADRFRPEEGQDFLSFAVPTIRGELKRYFRDYGWTVRPPRRVQEIHLRVLETRDRLAKRRDRTPTAAEIAAELGECEQHVVEALRLDGCFTPSSLDQPLVGGTASLGDLLADTDPHGQDAAEARVMLGSAVRALSARDRLVLRLRYFDGLTQREIGAALGVTQTQVSRILSRILTRLRDVLDPAGGALVG